MKFTVILYTLLTASFITSIQAQTSPQGLSVNDKAPYFAAKDQHGQTVKLSAVLKGGPVVVVFYRGQWCPYCNRQLKSLQDSLAFIKRKGATLIAVTPEKMDNISKTIDKTGASYSVLFDDGLKIMRSYDVAFAVDSSTISRYKKFGIDFNEVNGRNGASLPVPAVYIINREGIIIFKHFDSDYKKRVSVREILLHL